MKGTACVAVLLAVVWAGGGCSTTAASENAWGRPNDGLLNDRALQAVVDAQIRRDGPGLATYLGYEEPEVRARAAFALGSVQDPRARAALVQLLDDRDARVRSDAAFAIGQLPDTSGTRVLVERLREETDAHARLQLIQATGRAGGREAAALLLRTDIKPDELATFALALARIGNRGINNALAVERLVELTGHPDPTVRRNAAYYFGRSTESSFWSPVVPRLRERLASYDRGDQAATWLLRGLAQLGSPADTDVGRVWLAEATDWRIRHAAADLLRNRQADGVVVAALRTALADSSPHVRETAARGLGTRGRRLSAEDYAFIETWIEGHLDDRGSVAALLPAMVSQDPSGVIEWGDRFAQDSPERTAALRALSVLPDAAIVEREFVAARGEGATARAALEALEGRVGASNQQRLQRVFAVAQEALASTDVSKVRLGSLLLAHPRVVPLGSVAALSSAIETADEERSRILYRALAATQDASALPQLLTGLESADATVQAEAAAGVELLTGEIPTYEPVVQQAPSIDWPALAERGRYPRLAFETPYGEIIAELDSEQAPLTVQTMMDLAESGALDGVPFHRVVPAFVIQGGDVSRGDGTGSAPITIRSEFTRLEFAGGTLGMASAGKDTEGSQFFITHLITPHLNGGYTAFGRVVSGQEFVDRVTVSDPLVRAYVLP